MFLIWTHIKLKYCRWNLFIFFFDWHTAINKRKYYGWDSFRRCFLTTLSLKWFVLSCLICMLLYFCHCLVLVSWYNLCFNILLFWIFVFRGKILVITKWRNWEIICLTFLLGEIDVGSFCFLKEASYQREKKPV